MPEPRDLHHDSTLSNLSVQYRNEEHIWPMVMPIIKVKKSSDFYYKYDKGQRFREVSDKLGPKSMPNELDLILSDDKYSVEGHGLGDWVSQEEMDNADSPLIPLSDANDLINDVLDLNQERRVANIAFNAASYPVGNKVQLSGTGQWGGSADSPILDIMNGLDAMFKRGNTIVFGNDAWTVFRTLPEILDAVKSATRNQGAAGGIATQSEVAGLFEVPRVIVGRSRVNTGKEGQPDSYSRVWGKHCALLYVQEDPGIRSLTFGGTFSEMQKKSFTAFDGKPGTKGATYVKTAWNSDEKVIAGDVGYFIEDAVA